MIYDGYDSVGLWVRRFFSIRSSYHGVGYGGCVYFISNVTGIPIIWRKCGLDKSPDIVFPWERRVFRFIVDRHGIVFSSDVDGNERWSIFEYRNGEILLIHGDNGSISQLGYRSPSGLVAFTSNDRNGVDFDLYVYNPFDRSVRKVVELEGLNFPGPWVDDERVLVTKRISNLDMDILIVNTKTGMIQNITKHKGEALNVNPRPLSDGSVVFASNMFGEYTALAMWTPRKGVKVLARHDWNVELVETFRLNGGRSVLYTVNVDGESYLYSIDPYEGKPSLLLKARGTISKIHTSTGGHSIILSISSPIHGREIYLYEYQTLHRYTYTPKAGISEEDLSYPEHFSYKSFDGLLIRGLYYRPKKPVTTPPPAVIWLHGGPESMVRVAWYMFHQVLASLGIAVVAPNYRGSLGYGKSFLRLDDVEKRENAVHDVYYAVKRLAKRGMIDPDRVCVMGGSYGGYLALMSMALYPEAWRCGVEIVGIVNLVTFIRNTSKYRRRYRIPEYGDPDKHYDIMMKLSPITYIDRFGKPLMIVHGANDPRVPVSEAEQLVKALRERGIQVEYVRLEDEGHGISKVENRVRVYTKAVLFILEHLLS